MYLIDTHCHFDDASFDHDRDAAWQRALAVGVTKQVVPAIRAELFSQVARVCRLYPGLYPAYGLHPIYLSQHQEDDLQTLRSWLENVPAVAVGECGLDFYLKTLNRARQQALFRAQLALAVEFDLPLIIHARHAVEAVLLAVREFPQARGVVHSFSGSYEQAMRLLDRGFYLSFGGPLTYPRAQRLRELVKKLPLERILLETDAPDQPLHTRQGMRNEPALLVEVLNTFASLRGISAQYAATVTTENAQRLFPQLV